MLSEEERRQIEAEEWAAAQAERGTAARARRRLAALAYRQEVRAALRPRPFWWSARWALVALPVTLSVLWVTRPTPATLDDASGGIGSAELMARCEEAVGQQLPVAPGRLRFPAAREAAGQFTANADGKRWDGWAERAGGPRTEFSCSYTAADGSVAAQLLGEDQP